MVKRINLLMACCITIQVSSQQLKEISIGANFFETESFGNNPFTISSLMKNPFEYTTYINNFTHNAFFGTGNFYSLVPSIFVNASFGIKGNQKWKKNLLLQAGLSFNLEESHSTGALQKTYVTNVNTQQQQRIIETLHFNERRNYVGIMLGGLYMFSPQKKVSFFVGTQFLANVSVMHMYNSGIHKITFSTTAGNQEVTNRFEYENRSWPGKTYITTRLFVPFGLNINVFKNYNIRPALQLGLFWPPKPFRPAGESHGFSIQLVRRL